MSTMLPGFGRCAGFSTSFWKIHGCAERQGLRRRMTGLGWSIPALSLLAALALCRHRAHVVTMDLPSHAVPPDPSGQRRADAARAQIRRAACRERRAAAADA